MTIDVSCCDHVHPFRQQAHGQRLHCLVLGNSAMGIVVMVVFQAIVSVLYLESQNNLGKIPCRAVFIAVLIVVASGHGFRMPEDTILLEIRQGPYIGVDEKERF